MDHPEKDLGTDWACSCDGMRRAAQEQGPGGSCWGNPGKEQGPSGSCWGNPGKEQGPSRSCWGNSGKREKYKPQEPAWPQTRAEMHRKEVVFLRAMRTELMPTNWHMPQWKG